ncbi:hypothetical protein JW887_05480 [Candidatus Dojkabacteria bacterium]|nr:hypothetical protein [Candidatus Dojkabacteria bacterium]
MTTLIIHPRIEIQKLEVSKIVNKLLNAQIDLREANPDIHIFDASDQKSIGIDEMRSLTSKMNLQPYKNKFQIGILICAEKLTPEAQNSLLKVLEEPNTHSIFILTTKNEKKLLPTIQSRCSKVFVKESLISEEKSKQISSELDPKIEGFISKSLVEKFLEIEDIIAEDKDNPDTVANFIRNLTIYYRNELIKSINDKDLERVKEYKNILEHIQKTTFFLSKNTNKRMTLENLILQIEPSII